MVFFEVTVFHVFVGRPRLVLGYKGLGRHVFLLHFMLRHALFCFFLSYFVEFYSASFGLVIV